MKFSIIIINILHYALGNFDNSSINTAEVKLSWAKQFFWYGEHIYIFILNYKIEIYKKSVILPFTN